MLAAMLARIAEFGFSPNKIAALGLNLLLLVHLVRSAWLTVGFLRGRRPFTCWSARNCSRSPGDSQQLPFWAPKTTTTASQLGNRLYKLSGPTPGRPGNIVQSGQPFLELIAHRRAGD